MLEFRSSVSGLVRLSCQL